MKCERCTDEACVSVVFVEQHGWDRDTEVYMCEECYYMYSRLYKTRATDLEEDNVEEYVEECIKEEKSSVPDFGNDTCFCSFCENFVPEERYLSDRCKKCHDRMWAELEEENNSE